MGKAASGNAARVDVSIVAITRGPSLALARFLRSLNDARGLDHAQVLLGVNGRAAAPGVRTLATRLLPVATVIPLTRASPAKARNAVIEQATAPIVLFLDDDVEVPPDLIEQTLGVLADDSIAAAGGPNVTPPASPGFERLAGRVLSSALGTGPLRRRYRRAPSRAGHGRNLMLCNLAVRRSALPVPPFDEVLASAEENELLARLRRGGARIEYRPELSVYHRRRSGLGAHLRQMAKYGFGRGQMLVRAFSVRQLVYTLPTLLLATVLAVAFLAPLLGLAAVGLYLLLLAVASLYFGRVHAAPAALALFLATHLGYSLGLVGGTAHELARRLALYVSAGRRSETARDAAGTMTALALAVLAGSAAGLILARGLGPSGRGDFELARVLAMLVAVPAGFGIGRAAVFYRQRHTIRPDQLFGSVAVVLGTGTALALALGGGLLAAGWHGLERVEIVLACGSIPLIAFYSQGLNALRGVGQEAWFRRMLGTRDALFVGLLPLAWVLGVNVRLALVAWLLHWLLGCAAIALVLRSTCGTPARPRGLATTLLAFGASQSLILLLTQVHLRLDIVVLRAFGDASDVGHYAVAFGVAELLTYGGVAIAAVLFPLTAASTALDPHAGRDRAEKAVRAALLLAFVGAVPLALGGPFLVELLFGSDFAPAGQPLRVLLPGAMALAATFVLGADLQGRGRVWTIAGIATFTVIAKAGLALALVPPFGTVGAATASSLAYGLQLAVVLPIFLRATRSPVAPAPALGEASGLGLH